MAAKHKWQFTAKLRRGSFGWRGSALAAKRLRQAVSEINKAGRKDPVLAAEGAIKLIECLWPALERIDTSSGLLGNVVNQVVHEVIEYPVTAQVDATTRAKWLERLWDAFQEDGVDYTMEVADRWGELCGSEALRQQWLDALLPPLRTTWSRGTAGGYYRGTTACLSCMLALGRHEELLDLVNESPTGLWHVRRYGVKALVALGRAEEAVRYAEASRGPYVGGSCIDQECEEILLSMDQREEAYRRYALSAHQRPTGLATFRAIAERYPEKSRQEILSDLINASPDAEGKWFATARQCGFLDLAIRLAQTSPCDPRTLNRAARDLIQEQPKAALEIALASLRWMVEGWGYEITGIKVYSACSSALKAAETLGRPDDAVRGVTELTKAHPFIHDLCRRADPRLARA